ncbi:MAG: N-acetyltransferase family protein [Achromobacter sp.]|uniref:GNAT family N-acetyltransferase n=1 Tax=Achromobacter sp. TaxID=134375 RepID=UPI003D03FA7D
MSRPPVTLRQATARDADAIAAMHAASWAVTYRGLLPDGFLDAGLADNRLVHWQDRLRDASADAQAVFIAEQNGQPIGFVCVKQEHDHPGEVLLDNLHVLPSHQGAGAGKLMVARAEAWARARSATRLYLYALEGNTRAIEFYERQGWRNTGTESDQIGGIAVRARRYERPV